MMPFNLLYIPPPGKMYSQYIDDMTERYEEDLDYMEQWIDHQNYK